MIVRKMMMRWFISLSTAQVAQGSFLWPVSDRWRLMLIDAHDDDHDDDGADDDDDHDDDGADDVDAPDDDSKANVD